MSGLSKVRTRTAQPDVQTDATERITTPHSWTVNIARQTRNNQPLSKWSDQDGTHAKRLRQLAALGTTTFPVSRSFLLLYATAPSLHSAAAATAYRPYWMRLQPQRSPVAYRQHAACLLCRRTDMPGPLQSHPVHGWVGHTLEVCELQPVPLADSDPQLYKGLAAVYHM